MTERKPLGRQAVVYLGGSSRRGVLKYGKAITAGVLGGLASLIVALVSDGVSSVEWLNIAIAVLGGSGLTVITPNSHWSDLLHELPPGDDL